MADSIEGATIDQRLAPDATISAALVGPGDRRIPAVSVVVPLHRDGPRFRRCLEAYTRLSDRTTFEVIVVSDQEIDTLPPWVVRTTTGAVGDTSPAVKRDIAVVCARAELIAFIDDDAYPSHDWLDAAIAALNDPRV